MKPLNYLCYMGKFNLTYFFMLLLLVLTLACKPDNSALHEAAKAMMQQSKWDAAFGYLDQAIDQIPNDATAYNLRGVCHLEKGQFEKASKDFSNAIAIDSTEYKYYYNRGNARLEMSDYNAALNDYNHAIGLNKNELDLYLNRGNLYYRMQQYPLAAEDFYFSTILDSTFAPAFYNYAKTNFMINNFESAIEQLKKAIIIEPKYTDAYFWLGLALLQIDEREEGCLTLQTAHRMGHKDAIDAINTNCNSGSQ